MSIGLFCQDLASFPAARARELDLRFGVGAVYALVWPDYAPPIDPIPERNRAAFENWNLQARVPLWAWINCSSDQAADARAIATLTAQLEPSGWLLDIEGEWVKGANLSVLIKGAKATGLPVIASLAGASSSHTPYDFRTLDQHGVAVSWQAYFDSGEGPPPADAVRELYAPSFVIAGWEYRHRLGKVYGWGKVSRVEADRVARFDSFKRPGAGDGSFPVTKREWGHSVVSRELWRNGAEVGRLMGRATYPKIRATLDVTRSAEQRPAAEWKPIAASARVPGARKRPIDVYLAERTSDDVLAAIAEGAAP